MRSKRVSTWGTHVFSDALDPRAPFGAFPLLLVFLRRIESLSPLAVLRDLNLSHPAPSGDGEDSAEPTVLKFNLSVYSRAPKEDPAPSTSGRKEPAA